MELALLTDCFIMISIYDSTEKRVTSFQSHEIEPTFNEITIKAHERFKPTDVSLTFRNWLGSLFFSILLKLEIYSTINTCLKTRTSLWINSITCCRKSALKKTWKKGSVLILLSKATLPTTPSKRRLICICQSILIHRWKKSVETSSSNPPVVTHLLIKLAEQCQTRDRRLTSMTQAWSPSVILSRWPSWASLTAQWETLPISRYRWAIPSQMQPKGWVRWELLAILWLMRTTRLSWSGAREHLLLE